MSATFHKMHGNGNDFVLLDLRAQDYALDSNGVRAMADRHRGVGFDQLLVLYPPTTATALARVEIWNADGSRAEQCGNGMRCIADYLHRQGEAGDDPFSVEGPVETIHMAWIEPGMTRVDMGRPAFGPDAVPTNLVPNGDEYSLDIDGATCRFGAVSMGNPHVVIRVEHAATAPVARLGPAIGHHPAFPRGCNVGFAEITSRTGIRLRVHERGAAETAACGSGACAAVAVLQRAGLLDDEVEVVQNGGRLIIGRNADTGSIWMTGPAAHVFQGMIE
ncbi:diaminopimelate epimerase [Marinihelvus fidelis]|uniref:Diaminopimelate epimerase n=1 Tax=Marinihelvus fidelis TaxID=2613842 RepID=A0A5N0T7V1_9GAMM|nr:diaminopimelate epimerase [Marinihelvus fidelis]KAA9130851.1 diaminopimelate epimerase [Marinihelvus fidelis]